MRNPLTLTLSILLPGLFFAGGFYWLFLRPNSSVPLPKGSTNPSGPITATSQGPVLLASFPKIKLWLNEQGRTTSTLWPPESEISNIHPEDYHGAAGCKKCHPKNHEAWSNHPHRWMNSLANEESVKGDFSGKAFIDYKGGKASFERFQGKFRMKLERPPIRRIYEIHQTIGVRFYQYYVGTQIEGPEPPDHHFYHKDHVLPFGYWLDRKEWVPVVHIGPEQPDTERSDPFQPPDKGRYYAEYSASCNACHTTFALGDMLGRRPQQMAENAPFSLNWSVKAYLDKAHPIEATEMEKLSQEGQGMKNQMANWEAPRYAISLGITCEACHLGSRLHAESGGKVAADFLPSSPFLTLDSETRPQKGRTHDNINWVCGRCHTGIRPTFAAGMSTWNSVEFADAMKGSCYTQLKCTDCHDPHNALGNKWSNPPKKDDSVCLKCHDSYRLAEKRLAHTRHNPGSEGDRCLNCHMPRINEGLNGLVRTHMIFSPTRKEMIHENQPNACNLCHIDKPIDWTLEKLKDWYGKTYEDWRIGLKYPNRPGPVAKGWLANEDPSVRLVGVTSLIRSKNPNQLPEILGVLDDPFLINRQFTGKALEEAWELKLADFGFRFYQGKEERKVPLERIRAHFLKPGTPSPSQNGN